MKYLYIIKSNESSINDKVQSSYIEFTLKKVNNKFLNNNFLGNMMFNQIK
jgi:hypothetical protein